MAIGIESGGRVDFAGLGLGDTTLPELDLSTDAPPVQPGWGLLPVVPGVGTLVSSWAPAAVLGIAGIVLLSTKHKKLGTAALALGALNAVFLGATVTQAYATGTPLKLGA